MARLLALVPGDQRLRRSVQLLVGLVGMGVTAAMLVLAGLGLDPWDVLHQGLSRTFGLAIGTWAVLVDVLVLFAWRPLRQPPGAGTVANAVIVGLVMDLVLSTFHSPHAIWARIALLVFGVIGNGIATGVSIGAGLGPGPRDGLSTGIAGRGRSMRVLRTGIRQPCWSSATSSAAPSGSGRFGRARDRPDHARDDPGADGRPAPGTLQGRC